MAKETGEPHNPCLSFGPLMTDKSVASHHAGITVSHWIRCKEANPFDSTMEDTSILTKARGHGHGSRLTTKVVGFNLHQGTRQKGSRAAPSPIEGPGRSALSQFCRKVCQPIFQSREDHQSCWESCHSCRQRVGPCSPLCVPCIPCQCCPAFLQPEDNCLWEIGVHTWIRKHSSHRQR